MNITPHIIQSAYEFLRSTPPFSKWNLPDGEDVKFRVGKSKTEIGWHNSWSADYHEIVVSSASVTTTITLLWVVAHEMIHLHQRRTKTDAGAEHNPAFFKYSRQVAVQHGFDP